MMDVDGYCGGCGKDIAECQCNVIPFPSRLKHTNESQQFADILHEHWSGEFTPNGDRR